MESLFIILLISLYGFNFVCSQSPFLSSAGKERICRKPIVEITVSPLIKSTLRELEVSWDVGDQWKAGDWIGLYKELPENGAKPLYKTEAGRSTGWVRTGIPEGRKFQEEPNFNKICLGFWTVYWRANSTNPVASSCLSSNPRWMEDSKKVIRNLKIREMFLPGTHDSGAFYLAYEPYEETRLNKYVFAQDETILEQLIHGARYLDFRIGYYKGTWWLNHGIFQVHPLEQVLEDVKEFMDKTKEIVVIDIHAFPAGFTKRDTHYELIKYLRDELGSYVAPPWLSWNANLGQLWDRNKRLILSYNDRSLVAENLDFLWSPVSQKWPDVRSVRALYSFFNDVFKAYEVNGGRGPSLVWAAMAELTPDAWGVIIDKYRGLRNMADMVNRNVTEWFRGDWGRMCNAVAVDFIRSTGIVEAAIRWNIRKGTRSNCDP
uniref:Secreted Phospholipase C-like protein n=1 Tax=Pristhesancus plagipennis TaxID=1955184 RepID=A0A2K8JWY1_PRIPG|nr:secreted Phospholipase C-like protein [Pristhesancus plagipennis]